MPLDFSSLHFDKKGFYIGGRPRKTRICKRTTAGGATEYYAQHKGWFFWYDFEDYEGNPWTEHTNPYTVTTELMCLDYKLGEIVYLHNHSLLAAQTQIDCYLESFDKKEKELRAKWCVKEEYIKYP